jgi:membrane-associated phospholipid phosphatase
MARLVIEHVLRAVLLLSLFDPLVDLDHRIQNAVQGARAGPLEGVMHAATDVGRRDLLLGVLLGLAVWGGPAGIATAREAVIVLLPTNLVVEGLKRAVDRTRPDGDTNPANASFPSSHAANAFAVALVFARRWRRLAPAFFSLATLVACSRVYLNRHFASDALCGAIIGVACAWLILRLIAGRRSTTPAVSRE